HTAAPDAPRALENVTTRTTIGSVSTPAAAAAPRPSGPTTPVACASSSTSHASCWRASSARPATSAHVASVEKTVSLTMTGRAGAVFKRRLAGRVAYRRVHAHSQVVVRREVDHRALVDAGSHRAAPGAHARLPQQAVAKVGEQHFLGPGIRGTRDVRGEACHEV